MNHREHGFTLIELGVTVAIIALLLAILMPSLSSARRRSKTMVCATNQRNIGQSMSVYLHEYDHAFPPSYVFPDDNEGAWSVDRQDSVSGLTVLHWSELIGRSTMLDQSTFQCPEFDNGGAPRTNPGRAIDDWETGQIDQGGATAPNDLVDQQAPRMAYTMNAGVIPPNRFTSALSGGARVNALVREHQIRSPGGVILGTEFINDWQALSEPVGDSWRSLSHRPIDPFAHPDSGFDEYDAPRRTAGYVYGSPTDDKTFGLLGAMEIRGRRGLLASDSEVSGINAVGRSHPTGDPIYDEDYGGGANFLFGDGHVETLPVLETLQRRRWGERYYSISGSNKVISHHQSRSE